VLVFFVKESCFNVPRAPGLVVVVFGRLSRFNVARALMLVLMLGVLYRWCWIVLSLLLTIFRFLLLLLPLPGWQVIVDLIVILVGKLVYTFKSELLITK
jgi:hypothetical protein